MNFLVCKTTPNFNDKEKKQKKIKFRKVCLFVIFLITNLLIYADGTQPIGSGTEDNPYEVVTLENLLWISTNDISWDKYFIQTADIDASDTQNWNSGFGFSPIGNSTTSFTGNYDGDGFFISNLFIDRIYADIQGLFGNTNGAYLEEVHLIDVDITARAIVGSLVGWGENLNVVNCSATGTITTGTQISNNNSYAGGLIGRNSSFGATSTISNCYTDVDIIAIDSQSQRIGGITGFMLSGWIDNPGEAMLIENCYALGSIEGHQDIGGLVGVVQVHTEGETISVSNCYSIVNLPAGTNNGGIIGERIGVSVITDVLQIRSATMNSNLLFLELLAPIS